MLKKDPISLLEKIEFCKHFNLVKPQPFSVLEKKYDPQLIENVYSSYEKAKNELEFMVEIMKKQFSSLSYFEISKEKLRLKKTPKNLYHYLKSRIELDPLAKIRFIDNEDDFIECWSYTLGVSSFVVSWFLAEDLNS